MIKIATIIILIMNILGMAGCSASAAADGFTDNNVTQFKDFITEPGVQLVDVRTPEEFTDGHIEGADNINYYDRNFLAECQTALDKSRPVAVYCRSGHRSGLAAEALTKAGFKVTNLVGGILAWTAARLPTTK